MTLIQDVTRRSATVFLEPIRRTEKSATRYTVRYPGPTGLIGTVTSRMKALGPMLLAATVNARPGVAADRSRGLQGSTTGPTRPAAGTTDGTLKLTAAAATLLEILLDPR